MKKTWSTPLTVERNLLTRLCNPWRNSPRELSEGCSANLKISSIQQVAEITAPNGENTASYNRGWTDIQTKEEHRFFSESASVYLQAFREARAEMKAAAQDQTLQGGTSTLDVQA